jgi:cell division protein FtsI/penicillin-binding protein 2
MNFSFFSRIRILSFCIIVFALILIAKLFLVQVIESSSFKEKADRQYATPTSDLFERNSIYFETKNGQLFSAGVQTTGFKLAINPKEILDIENTFNKLKEIISIDYEKFKTKAERKTDPYEEIANHLSKAEADSVSALNITGASA